MVATILALGGFGEDRAVRRASLGYFTGDLRGRTTTSRAGSGPVSGLVTELEPWA
jgi:hypothetical protein